MRIVVMMFAVACSSSSPQDPVKDASPVDANTKTDASENDASSNDATPNDAPTAGDAKPSEGQCAACTANDCLNELQACGASQPCVNDLVTFNNCLGASSGDCGTELAAGGAEQAALWACLSTKCSASCGTQ